MVSSRVVGAGAFVVLGVLLFTVALFTIGERRMLFDDRFDLYTEFNKLGQLEVGAVVRVAGMNAGEVTEIKIPASPAEKFRVKMEVREDIWQLIRTDSVATSQTEGLVGAIFLSINVGSEKAPQIPEGGTIPSRDPFLLADVLQQASDTVDLVSDTVEALRGDIQTVVQQLALTAEDMHGMVQDIRPDITAVAEDGRRIADDTQRMVTNIREGNGTLGKLINDDQLYVQVKGIADDARGLAAEAKTVLGNAREVSNEARRVIADFRSEDGPAQGLLGDMRVTVGQAREAVADLADNMEALKRNFLLRGFFKGRGYYDLDAISPAEYRDGMLENGKRKAMRIWVASAVLFEPGPDGKTEVLSADGRARLDSAMDSFLKYLPSSPIVVEGYASTGTVGEAYRQSRQRAGIVREYIMGRYELSPQNTGFIALGKDAAGSPKGAVWDGVSLTLFLDREALQFRNTAEEPVNPALAKSN